MQYVMCKSNIKFMLGAKIAMSTMPLTKILSCYNADIRNSVRRSAGQQQNKR